MHPGEELTIGNPNLSTPVHTPAHTMLAPLVLTLHWGHLHTNTGETAHAVIPTSRPLLSRTMVNTEVVVDIAGGTTKLVRIMDNRETQESVIEGIQTSEIIINATGKTIQSRRTCRLRTLETLEGPHLKTRGLRGQSLASHRHTGGSKTR